MYATRPLPAESIDAILWGDLGPLDRVMVRSAHVLVRVVARLRERLDPRFDPFLALYDRIAAAPPEHFTRLWATPGWPAWALVAERLVHAPDSLELAEHLAQFGGLAVGLALQTGGELRLETPWPATLPVLVPGLEWQIEGEGTVLVRGVRDGTILFDQDGATAQPAPRAHRGGFSLAVSRTAGHLPWI